jgi:hypothetical protein
MSASQTDFCYLASKSNRRRIVRILFGVSKFQLEVCRHSLCLCVLHSFGCFCVALLAMLCLFLSLSLMMSVVGTPLLCKVCCHAVSGVQGHRPAACAAGAPTAAAAVAAV